MQTPSKFGAVLPAHAINLADDPFGDVTLPTVNDVLPRTEVQAVNPPKEKSGGPTEFEERKKQLTRSDLVKIIVAERLKKLPSAEWNAFLVKIRTEYPFANDAIIESLGGGNNNGGSETDWKKYGLTSMIDLSRQKIDTTQYLLGEGWLERGGGGFIVAPSGIGKTVLVSQAGFLWSVGKTAFGLRPYNGKPLKVILVQAENPKNKMIRTSWMWLHLGFTGAEAKNMPGELSSPTVQRYHRQ
jgi:AAA domain